ncbi:MAG TPA: ABC transporter permease [Candidatus Limnocylindria bacterium]|nr:ABC transporter permease [Candidatus Limnocylindria bacterium]
MSWFSGLFGKRKREKELDEEVRSHLDMATRERVERGEAREEAERAVRREFGNVGLVKEVTREISGWGSLDRLMQDLRFGVRVITKSPGFTAVAILTLALGIGANTALFSVVNGVLLNPLPYPDPEQLVTLHESKPNFEAGSISFPNFRDWRKQNTTFSMMGVSRGYSFNLTGAGDTEQVRAEFVSTDFLPMLGVKPVVGRSFEEGEDEFGASPIVIISAGFWNRKFASAQDVLGKGLTLDGRSYAIVGVVPANFNLQIGGFRTSELYVPIGQWTNSALHVRAAGLGIHGIGRLKAGVTIQQARADMLRVTGHLAEEYPDSDKGIGATLIPLKEQMVGDVRRLLLVLLAAVGFVLLIACVNVANLLMARSMGRSREFAVRAALGAGRGRIVRQLLTESMLLALAGGGLGLLLAAWGTKAALQHLPSGLPRASEIGMDWKVLLFTAGIALFSGILFGLVPALRISKSNLQDTLKEGGRGSGGGKQRAQGAFVVAEMAMALVLLVVAGLMIRSLNALWSVNPGFDSHNVLTFGVSLPSSMRDASPGAIRAALRGIQDKLGSTPDVKAMSLSWAAVPLSSDDEELFWLEGQPKPASENDMNWAISYVVQEDYLKVMGIPLERGRFFMPQDRERSQHVIVIDDVFARKFFGDQDPIGKRVNLYTLGGAAEIVGVVGHVKQWGLDSDDKQALRAQLYSSYMQAPDEIMHLSSSGTGVLARIDGNTGATAATIRKALKEISSEHVMFSVQTMEEIIADSLAARRVSMIVLCVFAALALGLASMGIYGVISYLVGQRTHEIGIRMALGARQSDVLRQILGESMKMTVIGIFIGLLAALGLTRLMANMLFGVSATDPVTFVGVGAILAIVAMAACYVPARRAMRVDPIVALRCE